MQKTLRIKMLPSEASTESVVKKYIAQSDVVTSASISGYQILKRSIDARSKQPFVNLSLLCFIDEPFQKRNLNPIRFESVLKASRRVLIIGAGPAGLFAAL